MANEAERKTEGAQQVLDGPLVSIGRKEKEPGVEYNVLDNYRSYTYQFTLAALTSDQVKNNTYQNVPLDFVIIQSSGKKENQFNVDKASGVDIRLNSIVAKDDDGNPLTAKDKNLGRDLVDQFNKNSPGRFDLFINDVEIETVGGPTPRLGVTLASGISFTVFEPYSINGFIEALHVAAVATGHKNYISASFLFKMSFIGYPDNTDISEPEEIPNATRYFIIRFTGVDIEVTERGTRYLCKAIPFHESGFGHPNITKNVIKVKGTRTVKEVLKDFADKLTEQEKKLVDEERTSKNNKHDVYKIEFANEDGKLLLEKEDNEISKATISDLWKEAVVYSFPDIGKDEVDQDGKNKKTNDPKVKKSLEEDNSEYFKLTPNKVSIAFKEGARVSECIEAIIRDSSYLKDILTGLSKGQAGNNEDKMIDYFIIYPDVQVIGYDEVTSKEIYQYTYIIAPYEIHLTRIPRMGSQQWKTDTLKSLIVRDYKYLYSGQNNDLLNFRIHFDKLFYEAVPKAMGSAFYLTSADTMSKDDANRPKLKPGNSDERSKDPIAVAPLRADPTSSEVSAIGNAGAVGRTAYDILARNLHEAVVNSVVAHVMVTFEILGDPVFLVTPSPGKSRPPLKEFSRTILSSGEVNYLSREIFLRLTFRNPVDIGKNGFYDFSTNQVPYSGVFRVTNIRHIFKDGVFTQKIEVLRMPGQILDQPIQPTNPEDRSEEFPDPNSQRVPDTTSAQGPSVRMSVPSLFSQLQSLATSINSLPSALTSAITNSLRQSLAAGVSSATSPLRDTANQLGQNIDRLRSNISNVSTKITSATQNINYQIAEAGEKLGIDPASLSSSSPAALAGILALSKVIPKGVNLKEADKLGVNTNFPLFKLPNLPPLQPKTTAPAVEQNTVDLENILKSGGVTGVASAFGVKDLDKIPSAMLSPELSNFLARSSTKSVISNPLSGVNNKLTSEDFNKSADKTLANLNRVSSSVEVNITLASGSTNAALQNSVTSRLGSRISSPLTQFIDSNNT